MKLIQNALKYRQVTITILLIMFFTGIYSLLTMPRREDPKITVPTGLVIAYYPGASASQVEEEVTKKLEDYLFRFEEVRKEKTYSTTKDGLVIINVEINGDVKQSDVFWDKLRNNLLVAKQISLPEGVIGPIVNSDFGDTEAMVIAVNGENTSEHELKTYLQRLEDKVRTITSASKIKIIGERNDQIVLKVNSEKLAQFGLNMQDVVKVLQSQNKKVASSEIKIEGSNVPIYTQGNFSTENEIGNQIVGASKTGQVIKISDIAEIQREKSEAKSKILMNDNSSLLLTIQMREGNNIVDFGKQVEEKIAEMKQEVPSNIHFNTIVNQPSLVEHNVSHFITEFFTAIVVVVLIVILLLPFRVALVAATAIPMSVAVTFAVLHMLGIELHQVSLAALIVVLGMVVDDAIVVADNYVELLEEGIERKTAAWRSASDLIIPILAATVTIIASFFPMVLLKGTIGEFIHALPVTVTIALSCSFVVAMLFTPLLCYFFIKKGLHNPEDEAKKRKSLLDYMQIGYEKLLARAVKLPIVTIGLSVLSIFAAIFLYKNVIKQKFFPAAERNQFVVEIWMPTNTDLKKTEEATYIIENLIKNDKRITNFTSFVGTSAPRFYYNFSPEFPKTNFAQILINTTDDKVAVEMHDELIKKTNGLIPDATVQVKLMQQGQPLKAPVEVRVSGDDIATLKKIGNQVEEIIKSKKGNLWVGNDFREDYYAIGIVPKPEAQRLGFTSESIAKSVYLGFSGASITKIYEGENPVDVVFRFDKDLRQNSDQLLNMYVQSPITGSSVPLRQIADLKPEWHTGNIVRRNGVKTLTVGSETTDNVLPSELLNEIQPEISKLKLPEGYSIAYGGEIANQKEAFSQMVVILGVSLLLIFLVILLQFRNLKETAIIIATIPLSVFGAMLGLVITGNNFGFMAFVGLISLSGIVVRNAIILIDHTNELLKEGMDIRTASIESGKRRLRPIFLTAAAAAFGVMPMIISNSPMWSPLASVIAVGVLWSMLMALITVPVLYIYWIKPKDKKLLIEESHKI